MRIQIRLQILIATSQNFLMLNQIQLMQKLISLVTRKSSQSTLVQLEQARHEDDEYDHLIAHLADQDEDEKTNNEWTRVFSRDDINEQRAGLFPMGPDLLFDKSTRDMLAQQQESTGEILFSPLNFRKQDLP